MLYIQSVSELEQHKHLVYGRPVLGLDIETLGLNAYKDPMRLVQLSNGSEILMVDVFKVGIPAIKEHLGPVLEDKEVVKAGHNLKFDVKFIKQQVGVDVEHIFDSYLASVLLECGIIPKDEQGKKIKGFHGLGSTVKRYLKRDIDKTEQLSDWGGELSQSQLEYAATDVEVMHPLREEMIKYLQKYGLVRCAKLEFEAILPVAWLELCGFYLDFEEWLKVAEGNKRKADSSALEICKEIEHLLPQGNLFGEYNINLDSHVQIRKYFTEYGIPMPKTTREWELTPLAEKYPLIQKLLDYRGSIKAYGTFGEEFKKFINPVTGRIHADFMQIGAATGRFATSKPNLSQIPKTKEHRSCFKAEGNNILISADYSQEELRFLADFSKDKNFLSLFAKGDDFHKATAAIIFNIPLEKVDSEARYLAKRMNFGVVYGIGAKKFSQTANIPEIEAEMIIRKYFQRFRGVDRWLKFQKAQVRRNGYNRTASGRMVKYDFDENDYSSISAAQREGANLPMQGTGADVLKKALRVFYDNSKSYRDKIKLVNIVHDQIDVESPKDIADEVEDCLVKSMVSAGSDFTKHLELKVDSGQSLVWEKE